MFVTLEDETSLIDVVLPTRSPGEVRKRSFDEIDRLFAGKVQLYRNTITVVVEDISSLLHFIAEGVL